MPANAFINKPKQPTDLELAAALGPAKAVWDQLLTDVAQECEANIHEWKCYSPKWGWSLRVVRKKRTIVWLAPCAGSFQVVFILGDKAVLAARKSRLPKQILTIISEAPKYPEGTGVRLQVRSSRTIGALRKLAAIKVAN